MNKDYIIMGRGYANTILKDPFITGMEIADIEFVRGEIRLNTTEDKLEKFVSKLMDNEDSFKVVDYFEKDSEEHRFYMYGPDDILK